MLKLLLRDYRWIHQGFGLVGNLLFVIGSVLFLPSFSAEQTIGVWLFITGSLLMLIGALGEFLVSWLRSHKGGGDS